MLVRTSNIQQMADRIQQSVRERLKQAWNEAPPFPIASNPLNWKVAVAVACECKTQLEAALAYAHYGIPVFPCNWKPDKEGKVNKRPAHGIGEGGLYLATIDPIVVRSWWTQWPLALIGVPQGRRVGTWMLDVDAKGAHAGDGMAAWEKLELDHGPAGTRTHLTGTNGLHLQYSWNENRFVGCPVKTKPGVKQGLWIINGKRQVIYALNDLSLRDQIIAAEELIRRSEPPKQEDIPF